MNAVIQRAVREDDLREAHVQAVRRLNADSFLSTAEGATKPSLIDAVTHRLLQRYPPRTDTRLTTVVLMALATAKRGGMVLSERDLT